MTNQIESISEDLVVITGAGSGLGRALAIELARRGLIIAGFGRRETALRNTAAAIQPGRFLPFVVDVSNSKQVTDAFNQLDQQSRQIRILINNAAIYEKFDFLDVDPDVFMQSVDVNLGGMVNCCHAALQRMTKSGFGRILNVTTFAHLAPLSGSSAYSVSKGAARVFTQALVADLGDRFPGIVISDWIPGALATQLGPSDGIDPSVAAQWGAELVLTHDQSLNGSLFTLDREYHLPRSMRQRIKDMLLLRKHPPPRRLIPRTDNPAVSCSRLIGSTFAPGSGTP